MVSLLCQIVRFKLQLQASIAASVKTRAQLKTILIWRKILLLINCTQIFLIFEITAFHLDSNLKCKMYCFRRVAKVNTETIGQRSSTSIERRYRSCKYESSSRSRMPLVYSNDTTILQLVARKQLQKLLIKHNMRRLLTKKKWCSKINRDKKQSHKTCVEKRVQEFSARGSS